MRYVALLRGIAPTNPSMRNENLRAVVESLGYGDVETVISSGNVLFDADDADRGTLEAAIEAAWPAQLGFTSTTIVRSADDLRALVEADPFGGHPDDDTTSLQVTFLKRAPEVGAAALRPEAGSGFTVVAATEDAVFSVVDRNTGRTPDLMRWLERQLGKEITTRTWKTVHRLVRKLG